MRIKLQTDAGLVYLIKRSDGVKFTAAVSAAPSDNPRSRWDKSHWSVWPKGHMEARMSFSSLHEALDHVIAGWWQAEGA